MRLIHERKRRYRVQRRCILVRCCGVEGAQSGSRIALVRGSSGCPFQSSHSGHRTIGGERGDTRSIR